MPAEFEYVYGVGLHLLLLYMWTNNKKLDIKNMLPWKDENLS